MTTIAVIVAAGSGSRFGGELPKQYVRLGDETVLAHCLHVFEKASSIQSCVLVVAEDWLDAVQTDYSEKFSKLTAVVPGGARRQDSVLAGVQKAQSLGATHVAIHDAARPFVSAECVDACVLRAIEVGHAMVALPARDTIKSARGTEIVETIPRETVWQAQTPQVFQVESLLRAFAHADQHGLTGTDEAALVEAIGETVHLVEGHPWNFKITTTDDLVLAAAVLKARQEDACE